MLPFRERNVVRKDWRRVDLKIAFCYPNVYRAGMSGLTVQLLYALLNLREDVVCERFFLPSGEGFKPLLSVESNQPLKKFDVIAFTFQYEEDYVNALKMLLSSGIEVWRKKRKTKPLLVAGGPCILENPAPLKGFFDLFVVGEVEAVLDDFVDRLKIAVENGNIDVFEGRDGYLTYNSEKARRVYVKNLDEAPHPIAQIVPEGEVKPSYMPVFGKTFLVEVVRGCPRRCRFCLISHVSNPLRERSLKKLEEIIVEGVKYTGVSKVTLIGAGIAYYPKLEDLCEFIVSQSLQVSVSSLSAELTTEKLVKCLVKGGEKTLTIAPETGCERLRTLIGKPVSDRRFIEASKTALNCGIKNLKLYFMVGLPNEKKEDLDGIVRLSKEIGRLGFGKKSVRLSVNPLIPKPHTPLQFYRIRSLEYLEEAYRKIRDGLRGDVRFRVETLNPKHAHIQAALSIGGEDLGKIVFKVALYGGGLGAWRKALKEEGKTLENFLNPPKPGEKPVWSMVDVGLNEKLLAEEYSRILEG
ncbi:MAG: radical SAM protein [Candidatus Hecatellales archaeon]|nr:MAG: radical SAM protein [Candidatus Hecatellales archaeon]